MPTDEQTAAVTAPFPYMRWAKRHLVPPGRLCLGLSGVHRPTADEVPGLLPGRQEDLRPALRAALAERHGIGPDGVHLTAGSSGANFLAYHRFARGGHVVAETPAYEALHVLAAAVGAELSTFDRDPARGWRIDPASLGRALRPETSLIAVTDLHNPSGRRLHDEDLALLEASAAAVDALVLVDEVYQDFDPVRRTSAATRGARFLSTNSLTKAHGLGDLRCGWILGDPARIAELDRWDDLVFPEPPHLPQVEALRYLPFADACVETTRRRARERCSIVSEWVAASPGIDWVEPHGGLTGFVRIGIDSGPVVERLAAEHGVLPVPGAFFQRPEWLRISYDLDEADLRQALAAIAEVVAAMR